MKGLPRLREVKRMTQVELGEVIGVDGNTISRYERNILKPSIENIQRLAEFFNVSVDELLNGPTKREIEIIIDLEGVDEMDAETIKANSVFCGYRGSDDSLIVRGAVPVGEATEEDIIERTVEALRAQLTAAYASRRVIMGK